MEWDHASQATSSRTTKEQEATDRVLSKLQNTWRSSSEELIQENLLCLSLMLSSSSSLTQDESATIRQQQHIQKGLFRILQRHYASYKKSGKDVYEGFHQKFDLLLNAIPYTFSTESTDENEGGTAFTDEGDDGIQVLIYLMQCTLDRHISLLVSVVRIFHEMSLMDDTKANVLQQLILSRIDRVEDEAQLPLLIGMLGHFPQDNMDCLQTIPVVRNIWRNIEKHNDASSTLLRMAHAVVQWFGEEWNGHFLATAYLQSIDEPTDTSSSSENGIFLLDIIVLLSLSSDIDFMEQAITILDSWAEQPDYFDCLGRVVSILKMEETFLDDDDWGIWEFCRETISPLINLSLRLLQSPHSKNTEHILYLCKRLYADLLPESERQTFANMVFKLWYKLFHENFKNVPRTIYMLMRGLVEQDANRMCWNLDMFVDVLESTTVLDNQTIEDLAAICVKVCSSDEREKLVDLVRHLLSEPVDPRRDGRLANGIVLATQMVQSEKFDDRDVNTMKTRINQILLADNRRVVPAEIASPGLAFLEVSGLDSSDTFRVIQMILANTGLIQRLSAYKQSRRKYTKLLAYTNQQSQLNNDKKFIFCIAYFLRHVDCEDLNRWDCTIRWVFDLVNTYLAAGASKSKTLWNPNGWLQAIVEFPKLEFSLALKGLQQEKVAEWIKNEFTVFNTKLRNDNPPPTNFRSVCTDIFAQNSQKIDSFCRSVLRYSLGILVGISISAAVLRNAFVHYKKHQGVQDRNDLLRSIESQVLKIFLLKDKVSALEHVLLPLDGAIRKIIAERQSNVLSKETLSIVDCNVSFEKNSVLLFSTTSLTVVDAQRFVAVLSHFRDILSELNDRHFLPSKIEEQILWEIFTDVKSNEMLKKHIGFILSVNPGMKSEGISNEEIEAKLRSKMRIASHLLSHNRFLFSDEGQYVSKSASFAFFLIRKLRRLRGSLSNLDSPPLAMWIDNAAVSIQLLTLCLMRKMERTVDLSFLMSTISPAVLSEWDKDKIIVSHVVDRLKLILSRADDVHVASGLLDILVILGLTKKEAFETITSSSAEVLRKTFTNSGTPTNIAELPYSLYISIQNLKGPATLLPLLKKIMEATLCKVTCYRGSVTDTFWVYRYSFLRHFGLLVQDKSSSDALEKFIIDISDEIDLFLDWIESKARTVDAKPRDSSNSMRMKKHVSVFPSLTIDHFADFFETCLHLIIGGVIMFPPTTIASRDTVSSSPYKRLQNFLHFFNRLVQLYLNYYATFPQKFVSVIYASCRHMMDVVDIQIKRCAEWRNTYRLPQSGAEYDPGRIVFLVQLVQIYQGTLMKNVSMVVNMWTRDKETRIVKKGKALEQWLERHIGALDELCTVHSIFLESDFDGCTNIETNKRQRRDCSTNPVFKRFSKRRDKESRGAPCNRNENFEYFGAAGEWGECSCSDEEHVDSVEHITILRTV